MKSGGFRPVMQGEQAKKQADGGAQGSSRVPLYRQISDTLLAGIREGMPAESIIASDRGLETSVFVDSLQWLPIAFVCAVLAMAAAYYWRFKLGGGDARSSSSTRS